MATHSVSLAPDAVIEWSDRDDVPVLESYCADPYCSPSMLCDRCRIANGLDCDLCLRRQAVVIDRLGPCPTPMCQPCADCCNEPKDRS